MDEREREIVELIGHGHTRHEIAEQLDIGATSVKRIIRRLCDQYDCQMRELPRVTAKGDQPCQ